MKACLVLFVKWQVFWKEKKWHFTSLGHMIDLCVKQLLKTTKHNYKYQEQQTMPKLFLSVNMYLSTLVLFHLLTSKVTIYIRTILHQEVCSYHYQTHTVHHPSPPLKIKLVIKFSIFTLVFKQIHQFVQNLNL